MVKYCGVHGPALTESLMTLRISVPIRSTTACVYLKGGVGVRVRVGVGVSVGVGGGGAVVMVVVVVVVVMVVIAAAAAVVAVDKRLRRGRTDSGGDQGDGRGGGGGGPDARVDGQNHKVSSEHQLVVERRQNPPQGFGLEVAPKTTRGLDGPRGWGRTGVRR